jgi:hypothetical protein
MIKFFNEEIDIWAFDDIYLEKIFNREDYVDIYPRMFDIRKKIISVLNKGICGNGGTTGFINYALENDKGLLVLVPNKSIVDSKKEDYKGNDNFCFVYGGVRKINVDAQIVIATYDQFPRLMKQLKGAGVKTEGLDMKFWSGRTIIIDEYHKLITESGFRDICISITNLIKNVETPIILLSATPYLEYVQMLRELLPEREIVNYNVIYPHNLRSKIEVYDIKEDRILPVLKKMMDSSNNGHICVFYNCVDDIKNLAIQLGDKCEILCSSARKDKLRELYSNKFNPDKKVHFLTSAFFTGCDIKEEVSQVVIVGSNEFDFMALDERDIKQILGRFRINGGGVRYFNNSIFYIHKNVDPGNYNKNKTDYDLMDIALKSPDFDWKNSEEGLRVKQSHIRLKKVLDTYLIWQSCENLMENLGSYGFDIEKGETDDINKLDKVKRRKCLSFKKVKEMVKKGLPVSVFQYKDIDELLTYVDVMGTGREFDRISKTKLNNWYKVHMLVKDVDMEGLSKESLCKVFDLGDHRIYNVGYLMECLDYFCDDYNYDNIPVKMEEYFGVCAVEMEFYDKKRYKNTYVLLIGCKWSKPVTKTTISYKENDKKMTGLSHLHPINEIPNSTHIFNQYFSYESRIHQRNSMAYSKKMEDICKDGNMRSLASNKDWKWMMEDKRNRLPVIKADDKRKYNLKIMGQSKMSELYIKSTNQFKFNKNNDFWVTCLVIDLDDGLPFSEFKEKYGEWLWYAMPTFSNIDDDWTKFRVIIPLKYEIHLGDGENNLKVLKCLRKMFCRWEDPNHQMYFQANLEDYQKTRINNGEMYEITQDMVEDLHLYIDNCVEFKKDHLDVKKVEGELSKVSIKIKWSRDWTLEQAKEYYKKNDKDGERHTAIFVIKNNILPEYEEQAREWLTSIGKGSHWTNNRMINE